MFTSSTKRLRGEHPSVRCSHVFWSGSSKSSANSAVIQDIMTLRNAGLAFVAYFCSDFKDTDKQNHRNLLLSLLSQLSARSDLCYDITHCTYVTHEDGAHIPTDDVLIQSL